MGETDDLAGGVKSAFLYAFHMQYQTLSAERTTLDLQMLRLQYEHIVSFDWLPQQRLKLRYCLWNSTTLDYFHP